MRDWICFEKDKSIGAPHYGLNDFFFDNFSCVKRSLIFAIAAYKFSATSKDVDLFRLLFCAIDRRARVLKQLKSIFSRRSTTLDNACLSAERHQTN